VLSVPQEQIGRQDHFFDRGGTSLSAVKLAVTLDRAFSLKDITAHPVLADLAALVDGRSERRVELLQSLSESESSPVSALVCAYPTDPDGTGGAPRRQTFAFPSAN
jgi:hypothetical protein